MPTWAIALGLGAGLFTLYTVSKKTPLTAQQEIQQCVNAALSRETDVTVLSSFQTKLTAAGFSAWAQAIGNRIVKLHPTRIAQTAQLANTSALTATLKAQGKL